jgi:hypothetical protein
MRGPKLDEGAELAQAGHLGRDEAALGADDEGVRTGDGARAGGRAGLGVGDEHLSFGQGRPDLGEEAVERLRVDLDGGEDGVAGLLEAEAQLLGDGGRAGGGGGEEAGVDAGAAEADEALDAHRGGLLQDLAQRVRPRQGEHDGDRQRRRRIVGEADGELEGDVVEGEDRGAAEATADEADAQAVADGGAVDLTDVGVPAVAEDDAVAGHEVGGIEEDEVHQGRLAAGASIPATAHRRARRGNRRALARVRRGCAWPS